MTAVEERIDVEDAEDTRERVTVWDTGELLFVHPVASLFPMMSHEELDDLAADIKANGLAHPIILDQHRGLVDGRNRLEACRRAEVSPDFIVETVEDPISLILSLNVARRHLSKGQAALAVVKARSFNLKDWSWGNGTALAAQLGVSEARVSQAHAIMRDAPELVDRVISNDLALVEAYNAAVQSKRSRGSAEADAKPAAR